jgi:hypothetical protein
MSIGKKWAASRQRVWDNFYDKSKTRDEIISNFLKGIDPIQWAHFVNYRLKPETVVCFYYFGWFMICLTNHLINDRTCNCLLAGVL